MKSPMVSLGGKAVKALGHHFPISPTVVETADGDGYSDVVLAFADELERRIGSRPPRNSSTEVFQKVTVDLPTSVALGGAMNA